MGEIKLLKRLSGLSKLMTDREQAASTFARLHCACIAFPISACFPPFLGMFLFKRRENQNSQPVTQSQKLMGPEQLHLPSPVGYESTLGTALLPDAHCLLQAAEKGKPTGRPLILSQTSANSTRSRCSQKFKSHSWVCTKKHMMKPNGHTTDLYKCRNPPTQRTCGRLVFCSKTCKLLKN